MCSVSTFASAPGKLILFGEHAVVYGHPALAGALSDLRVPCRVRVLPTSGAVTLRLPGVASGGASGGGGAPLEFSWPLAALRASLCAELPPPGGAPAPPAAALRAALAALVVGVAEKEGHRRALLPALFLCAGIFSAHLGEGAAMPIGGLVAEVLPPSLPVGAGLGSSAAVCTALSAALLDAEARFCGAAGGSGCGSAAAPPPRAQLERINAWAFAAEALFHGTPSGLDNTVSTFGGAMVYTRGVGGGAPAFRPIAPPPELRLLVVNTHVPKDTAALVAGVRTLREALPGVVEPLLQAIGGVAAAALAALEGGCGGGGAAAAAGAHERLRELVRVNQGALGALGVGHEALDRVVAAAARRGLAAKLTGAGGGGCALVLLPPSAGAGAEGGEEALAVELTELGFSCCESRLGGEGVLVAVEA